MKIISRGNTAEVFEYEEEKICKLFYEGYSTTAIQREYNNALCMLENKLPVPRAYKIVNIQNRTGIIYDRFYGGPILDKIIEGEDIDKLLNNMCNLDKFILSCHTIEVLSYKEFLRYFAEKDSKSSNIFTLIND